MHLDWSLTIPLLATILFALYKPLLGEEIKDSALPLSNQQYGSITQSQLQLPQHVGEFARKLNVPSFDRHLAYLWHVLSSAIKPVASENKASLKRDGGGGGDGGNYSPWTGKRKKSSDYSPWTGKRSADYSPWTGKRSSEYSPWTGKRSSEYSPWTGKRSGNSGAASGDEEAQDSDNPKPKKFLPWVGKRAGTRVPKREGPDPGTFNWDRMRRSEYNWDRMKRNNVGEYNWDRMKREQAFSTASTFPWFTLNDVEEDEDDVNEDLLGRQKSHRLRHFMERPRRDGNDNYQWERIGKRDRYISGQYQRLL